MRLSPRPNDQSNRLRLIEPSGNRWWAVCGGVYFVQAVKRVPGMRLIKPAWNKGLVGKLLPSAHKLHKGVSQRTGSGAK